MRFATAEGTPRIHCWRTGRDCKSRYMQCNICKQIKCVDEFVSKHSKRIYNKICRACLNNNEKSRLKRKE